MKSITSKDNKIIKLIKKLISSSKYRRESKLYVIEGIRICEEAIKNGIDVEYILVSDYAYDKYYNKIGNILDDLKFKINIVTEDIMRYISDTQDPQGIVFVCKINENELLTNIELNKEKFIILENIQDPSNLGTMLRTIKAFNISSVILSSDCCDIYNPKVLRGSMGAIFSLKFFITEDIVDSINYLQNKGITVVAGVPDHDVISIKEVDKRLNLSIAIGNEGNGLKKETIDACKIKATIPMNKGSESLNASIAASIMIWELMQNI